LKIIFVVTLLNALFWFATLGLVFSLARESKLERYTPIAAAALWPAFMVLSQSMAGYLRAEHFSPAVAIGTIAAAMIWTGWTLHHYRKQYAEMDWTAAASVIAVSLLAGCLVILPHIWNNDFGYSEFSNGEFLNYSQLASFSLGLQTSPDPVKWERYHQATRDGVDFINATVATLTQQQPVHIVQLTAALLRSAYLAGILLLVRTVLADVRFPTLATAAIGVVVAFNNLVWQPPSA
jgi:hypothetical protein